MQWSLFFIYTGILPRPSCVRMLASSSGSHYVDLRDLAVAILVPDNLEFTRCLTATDSYL